MHCSNDVGIYVNRSRDSTIEHNTLYNTLGIDVRYSESTANIENNVLSGRIKTRDNATVMQANNLVVSRNFFTGKDALSSYFVAPDIGNFSWTKSVEDLPMGKPRDGENADFCHIAATQYYVGAYAASSFCTHQLNLTGQENNNESGGVAR